MKTACWLAFCEVLGFGFVLWLWQACADFVKAENPLPISESDKNFVYLNYCKNKSKQN